MRHIPFLFLLILAACAEFPALDARLSEEDRAAPWPAFVPVEDILARADATAPLPPGDPAARIAALQARAAALRGPVIDAPTAARIVEATTP